MVKETGKQRMQLKAQRMRRYEKRGKFYSQNLVFENDAKKFYREIGKEKVTVNETLAINDIERFGDTTRSGFKDLMRRQSGCRMYKPKMETYV